MNITVLGAGAWGTALAIAFARGSTQQHAVTLWTRDAAQAEAMRNTRENARYLEGARFADALDVEDNFDRAIAKADVLIGATPSHGLRALVETLIAKNNRAPLLWVCKGFDRETGKLPHETVAAAFQSSHTAPFPVGALSGPSFADEVARGLPCALTLASEDADFATRHATALNGAALRVYSSNDLVGVEVGGALKNVMAIAAGIADGLQLGLNARAALITRGLAEMVRLGVAMGGKPETFMGLTGVGDLILTATGNLSRNRKVGMLLAEGKTLDDILTHLGHVAEGVNSAATTLNLATRLGVSMPITEAVNAVLFQRANPQDAVKALLGREAKSE
jgi:glycerol-3-phosphate dehydrogenase (NAD(P)+)